MTALFIYFALGLFTVFFLVNDRKFAELDVMTTLWEQALVVFVWPAAIFVRFLFLFCREDGTDPEGII